LAIALLLRSAAISCRTRPRSDAGATLLPLFKIVVPTIKGEKFGGFLVGVSLLFLRNFPQISELAPLLQLLNSPKFSEMGGRINFCGPIVIKTPQIPALAFALSPTEKPQIKITMGKAVFCFNLHISSLKS